MSVCVCNLFLGGGRQWKQQQEKKSSSLRALLIYIFDFGQRSRVKKSRAPSLFINNNRAASVCKFSSYFCRFCGGLPQLDKFIDLELTYLFETKISWFMNVTSLQKEKSTSGRNGWPATASSDTKSDTIVVDGMLSGTRILPTSSSFRFFARPFYVNKISLKLDWLTFLG